MRGSGAPFGDGLLTAQPLLGAADPVAEGVHA